MWVFISFFLLRYFVYVFDLVIFANAIFIALERNDAEVLFLVLFNIEILLKLYTYGFKEFFARYWNKLVFTFNLLFQLNLLFFPTSLGLRASKIHFILSRSESLESFRVCFYTALERQMWICTTWPSFLLTCALLFITSTPKFVASR